MKTLNEYVIELNSTWDKTENYTSFRDKVCDYARFLNQKPTLGMFVPVDDDGNVLNEPINFNSYSNGLMPTLSPLYESCKQYQQALDRVIFEGFEVKETDELDGWNAYLSNGKIEIFVFDFEPDKTYVDLVFEIEEDKPITKLSDLCGLVTLKQKQ